jgi:hypothetical protein
MNEKNPDDQEPTTTELNLRELIRVWGLAEADVIKSFLESNGIACIYRSLNVPSVYTFSTDGMGEIRIMVKDEDFETARSLVTEIPPMSEDSSPDQT